MNKCNRCKSDNISISSDSKYHDIYKCKDCNYMTTKRIDECCRISYDIISIEHRNDNLIKIYKQCMNCGGAFKTKPLSHKKFSKEIRAEFSNSKFEEWKEDRALENKYLWEFINQSNYESSDYAKYINYLSSKEWKIKRDKVFERDLYICQECKSRNAEQVHHITYNNLFDEPLVDLVSVCKDCHVEIHKKLHNEDMKQLRIKIEENKKGIS